MAFDAAEGNGRFGRIQCQRGKESSRGKRKRRVLLCRRTVGGKAIPASFRKLKEGGCPLRRKTEREGQIEELVDGQYPGSEAPPRSKKGQEKRGQRRCQERSDVEGWVCQGH